MKRLFFGISLDSEAKRAVSDFLVSWKQKPFPERTRLSWIQAADAHVTLRFLGQVSEEILPAVLGAGSRVASLVSELMELRFGAPGSFEGKVLWLGIEGRGTAALIELASALEREARALGFPPENKSFHPHLTLARMRQGRHVPDPPSGGIQSVEFCPGALILFESVRSPGAGGLRYSELASWRFSGSSAQ